MPDRVSRDRVDFAASEVLLHTEIAELIGDRTLESLVVEDNRTGERRRIPARALFVFIGADPHVGWLGSIAKLDNRGFVLTGVDAARAGANGLPHSGSERPAVLETTSPGVFAAGDVRSGSRAGSSRTSAGVCPAPRSRSMATAAPCSRDSTTITSTCSRSRRPGTRSHSVRRT